LQQREVVMRQETETFVQQIVLLCDLISVY
jgi:hypothetical protein